MATIDGWMPLAEFCEKHHQRANTIQKRVVDGLLERGVHYSSPTGGNAFVHEARLLSWLNERGLLKVAVE